MKNIQRVITRTFLVTGILSIALSSCKKDDANPKTGTDPNAQQELAKTLNESNWQITSMVADTERSINGKSSKDWFSMFKACRKDNIYTFSVIEDQVKVSIAEGATSCSNQESKTVNQALLLYMDAESPKILTGSSSVEPGSTKKLFDTPDSEDSEFVINQEWEFKELTPDKAKITIQILKEFPAVEFTTGLPSIEVEMKRVK